MKQRRDSGMDPIDSGEDTDMTSNQYARELTGGGSDG